MSMPSHQLWLWLTLAAALPATASAQIVERVCGKRMSVAESVAVVSKKRKKERLAAKDSFVLCNGGIIDRMALYKPEPLYPEKAKAAGISGTVSLRVCLDEEGKVYALAVCSGHSLLRSAAVRAAYQARFKPVLLSGKPTKSNGILTYKFMVK